MKRLHVHIAVENLDESIRFYAELFAAQPTLRKPDYAKWMLEDPQVNFAISQRGARPGLNHLGIQAESPAELREMEARLGQLQTGVQAERGASCCYAVSDKYWVTDPQGVAWEAFHTLDTIPVFGRDRGATRDTAACCIPLAGGQRQDATCCLPAPEQHADRCC
jgi:catechol 2,3-dioxygenase-like lactoylglutathione lyase family enzyme